MSQELENEYWRQFSAGEQPDLDWRTRDDGFLELRLGSPALPGWSYPATAAALSGGLHVESLTAKPDPNSKPDSVPWWTEGGWQCPQDEPR